MHTDILNSPEIDSLEELEYTEDTVTVFLNWTHQSDVSYHINVFSPIQGERTIRSEHAHVNLLLTYNALFNVSVTAILCGQTSATTVVGLNYGE